MKQESDITWAVLFWAALLAIIMGFSAAMASAQTCTPPIFQGSVNATGSCNRLTIRFLNTQSSLLIDRYEVRWTADGVRQTLPGSAIQAVRDDVTCQWSSQLEVTQIMKSGASCSTTSRISPAPHTPSCGLCGPVGGPGAGVSIVSSANFRGQVAPNSLASAFPDPGASFTDRAEQAFSIDLPTMLGGVSVEVNGQPCPLVAVAPGQVNFLLPAELPPGPAELSMVINTLRGSSARFVGRPQINPNAPGIFTANATGEGPAAAVWLVASLDGRQRYFLPGGLPALVWGDQVFLLLYGTGINETSAELRLTNGRTFVSQFVGATIFPGLQQLNFQIPLADIWRSEIGATVRVFAPNGFYTSQGFSLR